MCSEPCYAAHIFGNHYKPIPSRSALEAPSEIIDILVESLAVNTLDASFVMLNENQQWDYRGNKTECALLVLCQNLGL